MVEMTEKEKKIKKLLHTLEHTEEHFEALIDMVKETGLDPEPYKKIYEKLKDENENLKNKL
ncbi:MAG: hypothetical protein PWP15_975 [Methanothermococcus sp.]|jgi:predicted nucleotidyltransferase|uniref:hypothetical protein n=1 Tax=Methanothermococcus TaxID=155862 RepID=UPI00035E4FB2|nr:MULTISPECIES: hypothetical protein [Methanothermococcus]MDK2790468.1 hypothetical protein [Methanothermococcus sp.]MDK2987608.1 hypothetical protein [Methanothermococcus sp.]